MSVLIKGMEMPESCFQCWFLHVINPGFFYCFASGEEFEENFAIPKGRYKDCPIVEVKAPHGDLIDRDALMRGEGRYIITFGKEGIDVEKIKRAPTVIEVEVDDDCRRT